MADLIKLRSSVPSRKRDDSQIESKIRSISVTLSEKGYTVRRENLARGHAFRVKSGGCVFIKDRVLFVDKRLPAPQQLNVLRDFLDAQSVVNGESPTG